MAVALSPSMAYRWLLAAGSLSRDCANCCPNFLDFMDSGSHGLSPSSPAHLLTQVEPDWLPSLIAPYSTKA
jgi:hypothetical protein